MASTGDASITNDPEAGTWSISAGGATLSLALDASRDFAVMRLARESGTEWLIGAGPDTTLLVNGAALVFGSRSAGFVYQSARVKTVADTLQLDAEFDLPPAGLRFTRHYRVASGSPTFETWTTYLSLRAETATVSNLNAFQFTVAPGQLRWLTGLRGDNADVVHDDAFTLQQKTLAPGDRLTLGAAGRSAEQHVPWLAIDGARDEFYTALLWSGAWTLTVDRTATGQSIWFGLGSMTTTVGAKEVDGPHAVFGVAGGRLAQASAALRSFALRAIRGGRPLKPLVTFNTWYAHGTNITADSVKREMDTAAYMGVELFVVDAGWYPGAGAEGIWDFHSGLGRWVADESRFPDGLAPLAEYAHSHGMKFGIWMEPERTNLLNVGDRGVPEPLLATNATGYGSVTTAQICLGGAAGRQWILDRIESLIETVQPDYLKWDNNFWINCDRSGHGHGRDDGNFAHVNGLYQVLSELRARHPQLLIENVAGGGNRLDLGMLRYTDVAWMDDRTTPSAHVRHIAEGLSVVFPPAYLLSFVLDDENEPIHNAPDLSLYVRSRMAGTLGLSFVAYLLSTADANAMAREIAIYASIRDRLRDAAGAPLTPQAQAGWSWDVLQATSADGSSVVLYAFQLDGAAATYMIRPTALSPTTKYEVWSVDAGILGEATGSELMATGIEVVRSPATAAHILLITAR